MRNKYEVSPQQQNAWHMRNQAILDESPAIRDAHLQLAHMYEREHVSNRIQTLFASLDAQNKLIDMAQKQKGEATDVFVAKTPLRA